MHLSASATAILLVLNSDARAHFGDRSNWQYIHELRDAGLLTQTRCTKDTHFPQVVGSPEGLELTLLGKAHAKELCAMLERVPA